MWLHLYSAVTAAHRAAPDSLFMDLVAGNGLQTFHVCPGQPPALLGEIFERRVLALRGCKTTQGSSLHVNLLWL